jgi:hypothetical protein
MGPFGADVFFGISRFLITTLWLRERSKNGRISLRDFYLRRSLRIWPLYYAPLGIYVLLAIFLQRGTGRDRVFFHFFPGYLTFTYTWFAGWAASGAVFNFAWSRSVEEQFYVVWASVWRILRGLLPTLVIILMIFLRLSVHFIVLQNFILKDSLPWRIAAGISVPIRLGVILAQILHCEKGFRILRPILRSKWIQCFLVAAVVGSWVIREDNATIPAISASRLYRLGQLRNVSAECAGSGCGKSRQESDRPSSSALEIPSLCRADRLGRGNQLPLLRNPIFAPERAFFQGSRGSAGLQSWAGRELRTAHFALNSFNPCGDRRHLMVW